MRVLVTGGLGMVGAWVLRDLLSAGHEPVCVDVHDNPGPIADVAGDVVRIVADVRDVEQMTALMAGIDAVVHLAALLPAESNPYVGYGVTAMGPITIFEAARRAGVRRVVWASAKAVYGELSGVYGYPQYAPVPEEHGRSTLAFSPVYSASKRLAEEAGRYYSGRYGTEIAALRFSTIFGPGKVAPRGTALIGGVIAAGAGAGPPVVVAQGADERDEIIYVRDVSRGVLSALLGPPSETWVFNMASGILISLPELADMVRAKVGDLQLSIGPGRDPFGIGLMYGCLDDTKARRELGYKPEWDLERSVVDFAESFAS
jgi:UDP-glucose 4-epimerase